MADQNTGSVTNPIEQPDGSSPQQETNQPGPTGPTRVVLKSVDKVVGVADCFTAYANFGNVLATPFDIQIIFSELIEIDDVLIAKAKARIVMTPEHAALLLNALAMRLQAYVETNGRLRRLGGVHLSGQSDLLSESGLVQEEPTKTGESTS
jgi:hypothetical protein